MRTTLKHWLVVGLLLGTAVYALAEDITLTTYYPSPRGVYQELKTAGDLVVGDITNPPGARLHVVQEGTAPAFRVDDELSDTSPFLIDQSGNVGIGTTNPSQKLEVAGNILSSGTITASDARFKANVAPIPDVLAKLEQVHGVTFSWNELARTVSQQPGKTDIGVLGQELQAVFPELVVPVGKEGYLTVDYARLSAVLLEGIKALRHQQQVLEERIADLEAGKKDGT